MPRVGKYETEPYYGVYFDLSPDSVAELLNDTENKDKPIESFKITLDINDARKYDNLEPLPFKKFMIDWGDGILDENNKKHTYEKYGFYKIKVFAKKNN